VCVDGQQKPVKAKKKIKKQKKEKGTEQKIKKHFFY